MFHKTVAARAKSAGKGRSSDSPNLPSAAGLISEPQIDHFVMAITSAEAIVQHTPWRPGVLGSSVSQIT
jgi:hypothetical protein